MESLPVAVAERRQQERVAVRTPLRIVTVQGKPAVCDAICTNVSHGGIAFETSATLPVGRMIEFEFALPSDEPCRYCVRVLYRTGNVYGAYYVNEDGSDIFREN